MLPERLAMLRVSQRVFHVGLHEFQWIPCSVPGAPDLMHQNWTLTSNLIDHRREAKFFYGVMHAAGETLNVRSLACAEGIGPIAEVTLLGSDGTLRWGQDQDMLRIVIPDTLPCEHALSFRVAFAGA